MPEMRLHSTSGLSGAKTQMRTEPRLFRHVMACLDHSPQARQVLSEAAAIAEVMGAELTALRVMETTNHAMPQPSDPVDWDLTRREEEAELRRLADDVGAVPDMHTDVVGGTAADCIIRKAREAGVDLTVLGVGGRDRWAEWGIGSTVRQVTEHTAGSVMIVPQALAHEAARQGPTRRVLVPLDSSSQAEAVLPIALRIAQSRGAELVLLHAVPDIEPYRKQPAGRPGRGLARRSAPPQRACRQGLSRSHQHPAAHRCHAVSHPSAERRRPAPGTCPRHR